MLLFLFEYGNEQKMNRRLKMDLGTLYAPQISERDIASRTFTFRLADNSFQVRSQIIFAGKGAGPAEHPPLRCALPGESRSSREDE
jgi:hypothetical protein